MYFLKVHINITLLSTLRSYKWSLPKRLPHKNWLHCCMRLPPTVFLVLWVFWDVSKESVYRLTQRHVPENSKLHIHHSINLKSHLLSSHSFPSREIHFHIFFYLLSILPMFRYKEQVQILFTLFFIYDRTQDHVQLKLCLVTGHGFQ
jgi:hypothetical protein